MSNSEETWIFVDRACGYLVAAVVSARRRIQDIERELIDHLGRLSSEGHQCLGMAKRMVAAIDLRINRVNDFLSRGSAQDMLEALRVLEAPLILPNDTVNKLISEPPTPPVEADKIGPTLEKLLRKVVVLRQGTSSSSMGTRVRARR